MSEIRNMCTTPYGDRQADYTWNCTCAPSTEYPGRYVYRVRNPATNFQATFAFNMGATRRQVGDVLVAVCATAAADNLAKNSSFSGTERIASGMYGNALCWMAHRITVPESRNEMWIAESSGDVTLLGCANYTPEDWVQVQRCCDDGTLTIPWFAPPIDGDHGTSYPPVLIP